MANSYTHFSTLIPFTSEQADYMEQVISTFDLIAAGTFDEEGEHKHLADRAKEMAAFFDLDDQDEMGSEMGVETRYSEDGYSIWSEGHANPINVAKAINLTLWIFVLDHVVALSWANMCDRPITDSFSGGAAVISKFGFEDMTSHHWAQVKRREVEAQINSSAPKV